MSATNKKMSVTSTDEETSMTNADEKMSVTSTDEETSVTNADWKMDWTALRRLRRFGGQC